MKAAPRESTSNITSPSTLSHVNAHDNTRGRMSERGREGTVRFMLNPEREQGEKAIVAEYFKPEEVEEVEMYEDQRR
jgi:CTD kinase subunit beta